MTRIKGQLTTADYLPIAEYNSCLLYTSYRLYKMRLHDRAEAEHRDMVDRYRHRNDLTYGEARDMLAASGIFFDLNCDEFERDEITEQFVRLCNKT